MQKTERLLDFLEQKYGITNDDDDDEHPKTIICFFYSFLNIANNKIHTHTHKLRNIHQSQKY